MAENIDKMDLRYIKTEKALDAAMRSLLKKYNFGKITVNDICTSALISRATFYARYTDKYDFLGNWLEHTNLRGLTYDMPYEDIEKIINDFVFENKTVIKNIVHDADKETQDILLRIVLFFLKFTTGSAKLYSDPEEIIFQSIYAGGLMNYIFWQVKHNFPSAVPPMNKYLYRAIEKCHEIETEGRKI